VEGLLDNAEKRVESDRKFQEDLDRKLLDGKISHEEYLKIRATKSEAEQKEVGDAVESLIIMQKKQLELIEKIKQNRK
jgi:phospholipid N-methyltransferase